jgi:hypothetical protein
MPSSRTLLLAFVCMSLGPSATGQEPQPKEARSSYVAVRSPSGIIAHYLRFGRGETELQSRTFIEKDGAVIATIQGVKPVSFSPVDDILLVQEVALDDDLKQYLLNIGKGQYRRTGGRMTYVFGPRYVTKAAWSKDGRKISLYSGLGGESTAPKVYKVADLLK